MSRSISFPITLLLASLFVLSACRTDFERIRIKGNAEETLEAANKYYDKKEYLKAKTLYELILNTYRGSAQAEIIYYRFADCHYQMHEYILSAFYFANFSSTYPNSELREDADFFAAYSNYKLSPIYRLDQQHTEDAINEFEFFVNRYPASERIEECNVLIDELRSKLEKKAVEAAKLYFDLKQYQSAVQELQNVLYDYPESSEAESIRYLMIKSRYLLAENSIYDKRESRYKATLEEYEKFIRKYPESSHARELNNIARNSEKALNLFQDERY